MPGKVFVTAMVGTALAGSLSVSDLSYSRFLEMKKEEKQVQVAVYQEYADREAEWILSLQQENGAVFLYEPDFGGEGYVNPYFACQAMLGLLSDGKEEHVEAVGRYLRWHTEELIASKGQISDYHMENGELVPDGKADSFDSYAAVYLSLLSSFLEGGGDEGAIGDWKDAARILANEYDRVTVNEAVYVNEGLRVAYLMDNSEVFEAAERFGKFLLAKEDESSRALGERYRALAEMVRKTIRRKMRMFLSAAYTVGLDKKGRSLGEPDLEVFYPDSVAQLYPAITGVVPVGWREMELYNRVCERHAWETGKLQDTSFEWSVMAYAAAVHGDTERLNRYLKTYSALVGESRRYPMHTANAGWILRSCNLRIESITNVKDTGLLHYFTWLMGEML